MHDKIDNITIALAGMFQAAALVRELTQTGKLPTEAYEATLQSIFKLKTATVPEVFGGIQGVKFGLEKIIRAFGPNQINDPLQNRYLLSLIHLQKKFSRSPQILNNLIKRLEKTQLQVAYFSLTHPTVIANLSDIYLTSIKPFKFRLLILGSQRVLYVKENLEKIHAILLAGIRAAVLWRQMGGSRLHILLARNKIKAAAIRLLAEINQRHSIAEKELA